ncbi:MAG: sugar phosphate isomerase/epimerase [Candidatus Nanoarchaeia archaeon]|nr:sugar phosphate isomerase/epimerase [Candidatus Nanoarchaeia archaeon]MDD5357798.1 sugar phosphate isomerase/epimerase [Candidatus Nanoarchaeia archaeon]MDD5588717.1 sugar phosphate isomerase/epimerase [Candidatus Nanoarchaeia archaeon]
MVNYNIKDIYQGGYSSLKPHYGDIFTGYRINPATFGLTTDPRTANVLQDVSSKLSTGAKHIEVAGVSPAVFEAIPNQQLKELNRLSKLTGVDISMHGPIAEPSGLSEHGFSETNREAAEKQMFSAVQRGHIINPDGNIPITFHSSAVGIPGKVMPEGKEMEEGMVINTNTGSIHKVPLKKRFFPGEEEKRDIKIEVAKINEEQWIENLEQLRYHADMGKESLDNSMFTKVLSDAEKKAGKESSKEEEQMRYLYNRGTSFMNSSYNSMKQLFDTAWQSSNEEEKEKLKKFKEEIEIKAQKIRDNPKAEGSMILMREIIERGVETLKDVHPKIYEDLNEFSKQKTVETFSNIAFKSYKEFKDKSPIISIENPPAGVIFSTGEELKEIVEGARKKFVEKAVKEGISETQAKQAANKLLGVTWDVGHINMLRKYGAEKEDIIKETEKVAPFVKHVHLSDNFGFEHTELPMGMGNVPVKEIFEKLGKQGFDARKIIEAAQWWEHFKAPPFRETLEAFGSPIYGMEMAPYWNQNSAFQQNYFGGYGLMLPQTHYETFGAGFSRLPSELGGQKPGAEGSRMSGKPME